MDGFFAITNGRKTVRHFLEIVYVCFSGIFRCSLSAIFGIYEKIPWFRILFDYVNNVVRSFAQFAQFQAYIFVHSSQS